MDQIIIFGTGSVSEYIYGKMDMTKVELIGFVKTEVNGQESFHDLPVYPLDRLYQLKFDYILIASGYVEKIRKCLLENKVEEKKIVSFIFDDGETYRNLKNRINSDLNNYYNRDHIFKWLKNNERISEIYPVALWKDDISIFRFEKDFVREQTVKLLSEQIKQKKINGDVAELGVYKGDFTVIINQYFMNKDLYLYDTFEGFSDNDLKTDDSINNYIGEANKFKDTNIEFVRNRLLPNSKLYFRKGVFPDSFVDEDKSFCFVSIDFNLYYPVKKALEIIYPLLEKEGYILVSDYYAPFYSGTKKAVDEFCSLNQITVIPIADFYGSIIITK